MQGEESYEALSHILLEHMQYNLFVDAHGVPQAGDMQVIPMAILEMLIQLREEKLVLLPALPRAFKNGAVKGIHAKGGYVLDWSWQDGKIVHLRIDRSRVFCEYIVVDKNGNLLEEC